MGPDELHRAVIEAIRPHKLYKLDVTCPRIGTSEIELEIRLVGDPSPGVRSIMDALRSIGISVNHIHAVPLQSFVKMKGIFMAIQNSRNPNVLGHVNGTKDFFVILNPESNLPITQTFDTSDEAWDVAEQMAQKCVGQRFFVLGSFGSAVAAHPIVRRESKLGELIAPKKVTRKIAAKTAEKTAAKKTAPKKTATRKR